MRPHTWANLNTYLLDQAYEAPFSSIKMKQKSWPEAFNTGEVWNSMSALWSSSCSPQRTWYLLDSTTLTLSTVLTSLRKPTIYRALFLSWPVSFQASFSLGCYRYQMMIQCNLTRASCSDLLGFFARQMGSIWFFAIRSFVWNTIMSWTKTLYIENFNKTRLLFLGFLKWG